MKEAANTDHFEGFLDAKQHRYDHYNRDMRENDMSCCNETVMKRVLRGLDSEHLNVPVSWIQMDDWWYVPVCAIGCES